jgi:hypothetical protein
MKKNFIYALMGAIALIGATGFTSCSEEDMVEVNPGYNPETGEVPVSFVFNVATGNTPTTRMTSDNTQAEITTSTAQTFRGIDNVQLMSFKLGTTNDAKHIATATATTADKVYGLGSILSKGQLIPASNNTTDIKSKRVLELAVPTETNALMFWGKAIKDADDFQQGKIDWKITDNKDISKNEFSLVKIVPVDQTGANPAAKGSTAFAQYQNLIAAVLTKIVQSKVEASSLSPITYTNTNNVVVKYENPISWSDYVTITASSTDGKITSIVAKTEDPVDASSSMCSLGEILADAFVKLNTIRPNELRAGSAPDVARTMGDLYNSISSVSTAIPSSLQETVAQNVASKIISNIEEAFTNVSSSCAWDCTTENNLNDIKNFSGLGSGDVNLITTDLAEFPKNFNLPLGAVILEITQDYTATDKPLVFSYQGTIPTYAMGGSATSTETNFDPKNYVYPAELCYFGNSPVRVTDDDHEVSDYPDGVTNWDDESKWAAKAMPTSAGANTSKAWTTTHVMSTTRSVAMKENINYGTALLKTTVRYGDAILQDNNYYIQNSRTGATEENAKFDVQNNGGLFKLTGILVGGQETTMGWNYVAKAGDAATFGNMVYDKTIPNGTIPAYGSSTATTAPCYTLLWDNWDSSKKGQKQRDVYLALEFENNSGKDFWGENNLIRNGGTFYITGKLDPDASLSTTDRSAGITWPDYYALPPYNDDGTTIKERRVFIQDYMTTANFVLGEYSLQHALVSVPDLRSSQISLGLSVDLSWSAGLSFDGVILGDDTTGHHP